MHLALSSFFQSIARPCRRMIDKKNPAPRGTGFFNPQRLAFCDRDLEQGCDFFLRLDVG